MFEDAKQLREAEPKTQPPLHSGPIALGPSISAVLLALNHDARYSRPTPLPAHAAMSDQEEDVAKVTRAVRTTYDGLQALRTSRQSKIPSSLYSLVEALDKLRARLDVLTHSPEAISIFLQYTVKKESNDSETSLSDALVHDMEAAANYFRRMKHVVPREVPNDLDEHKFWNVKEMVDRYEMIVYTVLKKHEACVRNGLIRCI
jgi:hypothetical protein